MDRSFLPDATAETERTTDKQRDGSRQNQHRRRGKATAEKEADYAQSRYRGPPSPGAASDRLRTKTLRGDHRQLHCARGRYVDKPQCRPTAIADQAAW